MRSLPALLLIAAAVALLGLALWLSAYAPPLSGGTGFAALLLIAAGALVFLALCVRPARPRRTR